MRTPWDLSEPARLEQLAEESAELAQAALKLARIIRGENPTPTEHDVAADNLLEEYADVLLCAAYVGLRKDDDRIKVIYNRKSDRWFKRMGAADA